MERENTKLMRKEEENDIKPMMRIKKIRKKLKKLKLVLLV